MAFFGVTIEEIESISPIEGADMIEMAKLKGLAFEFVVETHCVSGNDMRQYSY